MFKLISEPQADSLTIYIDGQPCQVPAGISIAAAVLLHNALPSRTTPVSGAPRAPFCMMGVCFDCLMEIDGQPNQRACQMIVAEGMHINRQLAAGRKPA
ncbi:MAG: (2Fe-2S)-binding protein [gamma proteobacterium symbiont of Bathyaustriella thionipta]|nr:(2Fe-2S)-binding protein [gamma proteobacterium symbiont of Bathyaustriella thionipta]